jgi:hypothetical protein
VSQNSPLPAGDEGLIDANVDLWNERGRASINPFPNMSFGRNRGEALNYLFIMSNLSIEIIQ